ncbi:FCD domain-containing protein [Desulfobacula sp.]|uniref:FadR/GntR family transcriptional regulator n=1 Tax=Desulfobacula sp. TaxID=2593537 RepID=UPI002611F2E2|nr:FCD domain-containing protein [Desulfobacula sp.]
MKSFENFLVPPKKETLSANIAAQLKNIILKQKLKKGDKLPTERALAENLQVSRVVIKQSLLSLEQSGFIEIKPGPKGGSFVKKDFTKPIKIFFQDINLNNDVSIDDFKELRNILESAVARSAAGKASPADVEILTAINESFIEEKNKQLHGEINNKFHLEIAKIAGNPIITNLLKSLLELFFYYPGTSVSSSFLKVAYQDHIELIEALAQHDPDRAEKKIYKNIVRQNGRVK